MAVGEGASVVDIQYLLHSIRVLVGTVCLLPHTEGLGYETYNVTKI